MVLKQQEMKKAEQVQPEHLRYDLGMTGRKEKQSKSVIKSQT